MIANNTTTSDEDECGSKVPEPHEVLSCFLNPSKLVGTTDRFYHDIVNWTSLTITFTLVFALFAGIIHYEWYGEDSQKRSLGNRLVSHAALAAIFENFWRHLGIILVRYNLGSLMVYKIVWKIHMVFMLNQGWLINLHTVLRYFQVVIWKRIREINEDLSTRIILITFYTVAAALAWTVDFGNHFFHFVSISSNQTIQVPLALCSKSFDPLGFK